jgi:glutamate/tyrosine decarboxylase-like PLP-dependent enzyme
MSDLLRSVAERAIQYLNNLDSRPVFPSAEHVRRLTQFDELLPDEPTEPEAVIRLLDEAGSPATAASAGRRYFGFVTGGSLPVTVAANWLATAWDQNSAMPVMSPIAAKLEEVALGWLVALFGLPAGSGGGLVTGATMANFTALAAARHAILQKAGWDVEAQGLFGAPEITVVVGDEVHASVLKALSLAGFGRERVVRVPVDNQGRMRAELLPKLTERTIVCIQAGNVNSGAFDPARAICETARGTGAWVHVDGAFGLWAAAAPERAHLVEGITEADSWITDGHKWLNVPYDCGLIFCRDPAYLQAAMSSSGAYLMQDGGRVGFHYAPEMSRRARAVEVWAALRTLGRKGLAEMIERTCRHAQHFADGLRAAGYQVLNDVVINQVLVSFGEAETTRRVIAGLQADGTCWCGSTVWQGHTAMRISVSSWATTDEDVERCLAAMLRVVREVG